MRFTIHLQAAMPPSELLQCSCGPCAEQALVNKHRQAGPAEQQSQAALCSVLPAGAACKQLCQQSKVWPQTGPVDVLQQAQPASSNKSTMAAAGPNIKCFQQKELKQARSRGRLKLTV